MTAILRVESYIGNPTRPIYEIYVPRKGKTIRDVELSLIKKDEVYINGRSVKYERVKIKKI